MNFKFLLLTIGLGLSVSVFAQNSHYWTQQYGNKSLLLGGAVAGSVTDLGSVYYNPGFLALTDNPTFVVTAKLMQFTNVNLKDGLGENIDLVQNKFGSAPGLIAGVFEFKFLPKSKFAYAYLTRRTHNIDFVYRTQTNVDALPNNPGTEEFTGEILIQGQSAEYWGGWTWSYPLNKHMSVGLSNFFTVNTSKSALNIDVSAQANDGHVVAVNRRLQYDYTNFGMIFKVGLAIKYPNFSAGISITPPKFKVAGSGFIFNNYTLAGADTNYIPVADDYYQSNYQENIPTKLKSPLSIAIGAGYTLNKVTFHISGEWFNKVDEYTVMGPEPFISQTTGKVIYTPIVEDLSSVINGGIAAEYHMNKMFQFYAGFATDFSASPNSPAQFTELEQQIDNSSFRGNIYHFSGGLGLNFKSLELTVGMAYNYGIDYIGRPINLPDEEGGPIFDSGETATLKVSNWKLLFGFALPVSK